MQNRLIAIERSQTHKAYPKHNDKWQKKPHFQEQRPPNTLEFANYVDNQAIPYCKPCGTFHEESTCHFFLQICRGEPYTSENEQINVCSDEEPLSREEWFESMEQSRVDYVSDPVDKVTEVYGKNPTRGQVLEMARHKGFAYQRRGKKSQENIQASTPKVPSPPKIMFLQENIIMLI